MQDCEQLYNKTSRSEPPSSSRSQRRAQMGPKISSQPAWPTHTSLDRCPCQSHRMQPQCALSKPME
eukprot:679135-Amphidinium_carterae.1